MKSVGINEGNSLSYDALMALEYRSLLRTFAKIEDLDQLARIFWEASTPEDNEELKIDEGMAPS